MILKYFFSIALTVGFIAFTPHAALEEIDAVDATRQSPTALVQPIIDSWDIQEGDPDLARLKEKATEFQAQFSDAVIEGIMTIGSRYVTEIQAPNPDEGISTPPSFNDLLDVLSTLADIESAPYDRPTGTVSSFAYNELNEYADISPPDHQVFYLKLFADILSQTEFDETLADTVIGWTSEFLRPDHSEETCSDIARSVRRYIQENPGEIFETSVLQVALQEEETWEDADVLTQIMETLGLEAVHNPSPSDDAIDVVSENKENEHTSHFLVE
jgi:hypothetical protein